GLLARFGGILDAATEALLDQQAADAGAALDKEELAALKSGHVNALRLRLFAEIAAATRDHALPAIQRNDAASRRALVAALETLEHNAGLLRLNLNELAALEDFLLASLRLWTVR
ncbi:MAG: DNA polymerase III subunit gamma/tau, partial [Opitutaceae bacterium]|nr:DNA polymerase III subunit gamma/tau [Opitutaceae bacterium]